MFPFWRVSMLWRRGLVLWEGGVHLRVSVLWRTARFVFMGRRGVFEGDPAVEEGACFMGRRGVFPFGVYLQNLCCGGGRVLCDVSE